MNMRDQYWLSRQLFYIEAVDKLFANRFDPEILKRVSELIKDFKYENLVATEHSTIDDCIKITNLIDKTRNTIRPYIEKTLERIGKWELEMYKNMAANRVTYAYLAVAFALRDKSEANPDAAIIDVCTDSRYLWDDVGKVPTKEDILEGNFKIRAIYLPIKWLTKGKYSLSVVKEKMNSYESELRSKTYNKKEYKKRQDLRKKYRMII